MRSVVVLKRGQGWWFYWFFLNAPDNCWPAWNSLRSGIWKKQWQKFPSTPLPSTETFHRIADLLCRKNSSIHKSKSGSNSIKISHNYCSFFYPQPPYSWSLYQGRSTIHLRDSSTSVLEPEVVQQYKYYCNTPGTYHPLEPHHSQSDKW